MSYTLLGHDLFVQQYAAFQTTHQAFAEALIQQLRVVEANPFAAGARRLHGIADDDLAGRILRRWVGGRRDHRLVYVVDEERALAAPTYVTMVRRADGFDWQDPEWLTIAASIFSDLMAGNESAFVRLRLPQ